MTNHYDVIIAPIITEKTSALEASSNVKVFKVAYSANKTQIKQAVEAIFKVKVDSVNTINVKPKKKRVGKRTGYRQKYKKAIITLADGNTLKID